MQGYPARIVHSGRGCPVCATTTPTLVAQAGSLPSRRVAEGPAYYHGTTVPDVTHILPAEQHGGHVTFPHDTSRAHAYATTNEDDAWDYAEKAFHAADRGHPRVYRVEPMGHVEKDPDEDEHGNWRSGVNDGDVRSPHGFKVLHEMPMPEHMGTPEDWR